MKFASFALEPWMSAHPWMSFFIAMAAINGVVEILNPSVYKDMWAGAGGSTPTTSTSGLPQRILGRSTGLAVLPRLPRGNGVYAGLVRS